MTAERWRQVGELFNQALEQPPEHRAAWVERATGGDAELRREVESLLSSDGQAQGGFVESHIKQAVLTFAAGAKPPGRPLNRVGPYRLVRELGRGGMGAVYLAERDDEHYRTQVAIKLLRPGSDTEMALQRFRLERQILADLSHPNIARLLDGGATEDGCPYIVMEYVEGTWITEYCRTKNLNVDDRLRLFLDVCSAVEHAHQRFVVHRDLKPGNILVDQSGVVKLLDFGISKQLHAGPDTVEGMRMLTPDYASPEQIRGDPITVASDVYSLAAVLYELLTGAKPHRLEQNTPAAIERAICEQDVIRPSLAAPKALARRLAGDLDTILLRALDKDARRRYPSAEQFSEDLRRHLSHQPVKARPDTAVYRMVKFARRRSGAVAATVAIVVSLAAGVILSVREARIANENLLQVRRLANAFVFDVHDAVRDLPGSTRARQLIVETGLQYLDVLARNARGDRQLQAELASAYLRIGDVQGNVLGANLGDMGAALASYRKALALFDSIAQKDPDARQAQAGRFTVLKKIASVQGFTQGTRQALAGYRAAERLGEELLSKQPGDDQVRRQLAEIHIAIGDVLRLSGQMAESVEESSRGLELLLDLSSRRPEDQTLQRLVATAFSAVGMVEGRMGRLQDALRHHRQSVAQMERLTSLDPSNASYQRELMQAYSHLGDVLGNPNRPSLGDTAGAIKVYRQILSIGQRLYEADRADQRAAYDYAIALARLAFVLPEREIGEKVAVLRHSQELLEGVARISPENQTNLSDLAFGYLQLGDALAREGDVEGATRVYLRALALAERTIDSGMTSPPNTLIAVLRNLGLQAARRGDRATALSYARRALAASESAVARSGGQSSATPKFLTARGAAAMGLVYTALASAANQGSTRNDDRKQAAVWIKRALDAWRVAQTYPAFSEVHRREMQEVEAALK